MSNTSVDVTVKQSSLMNDIIIHEDDLTEQAKASFSYHTDICRAFELNRRSILNNDILTPIGQHLLFSRINEMFTNCKQVLNYMATNSELLEKDLPNVGPIFICGLPRTGSTLLYNLLACDQNCRAPLCTDMEIDPVPPIARSNSVEHERRIVKGKLTEQLTEKLVGQSSSVYASHAMYPIEQGQTLLQQAGIDLHLIMVSSLQEMELEDFYYDNTNKSFAYAYHETFLRMLNSVDAPRSQWVLKTPAHALSLDTLFNRYANTCLIITHRSLDDVLPSFCRAMLELSRFRVNQNDPKSRTTIITRSLRHLDKVIERIIEFRNRSHHLNKKILDINYTDLMEKPIATVRRIYDYFNLEFSQNFEIAMLNWLQENPQGKQGRNTYSLEEFGLVHEDIETRYADYINLFLRASV